MNYQQKNAVLGVVLAAEALLEEAYKVAGEPPEDEVPSTAGGTAIKNLHEALKHFNDERHGAADALMDDCVNEEPATLRDQFAMAAPAEIPAWFEGPSPEPFPDNVNAWDFFPNDLDSVAEANRWANSKAKPEVVPEKYQAFVHAHIDRNRRAVEISQLNHRNRFIAWRWHYADLMMDARQTPHPL